MADPQVHIGDSAQATIDDGDLEMLVANDGADLAEVGETGAGEERTAPQEEEKPPERTTFTEYTSNSLSAWNLEHPKNQAQIPQIPYDRAPYRLRRRSSAPQSSQSPYNQISLPSQQAPRRFGMPSMPKTLRSKPAHSVSVNC